MAYPPYPSGTSHSRLVPAPSEPQICVPTTMTSSLAHTRRGWVGGAGHVNRRFPGAKHGSGRIRSVSQDSIGAERARLASADAGDPAWRAWGPYLSERAWGTVREDYSDHGTAWDYFPHDHSRSRVYRWNEDGLFGISDQHQHVCFALT